MTPPSNRNPVLLKTQPAEYPKGFEGSGMAGEVVVSILVDRMGRASHVRVEGSPDPAFTDAALAALNGYEFLPALRNGKVTNAPMQLIIPINEDIGDRSLIDYEGGRIELLAVTTPVAVDVPVRRLLGLRPVYPLNLLAAGKSGEVVVEFHISENGIPRGVKIVEETLPEFSSAVRGALALWKFSPAQSQGKSIVAGLRYRVSFQADEIPEPTRAVARRLLAGEAADFVPAQKVDRPPRAIFKFSPVSTSREAGSRGDPRRASVAFLVDPKGKVLLPQVLSASDPVSGYIALAAVNYWTFQPALANKQPVQVMIEESFRF